VPALRPRPRPVPAGPAARVHIGCGTIPGGRAGQGLPEPLGQRLLPVGALRISSTNTSRASGPRPTALQSRMAPSLCFDAPACTEPVSISADSILSSVSILNAVQFYTLTCHGGGHDSKPDPDRPFLAHHAADRRGLRADRSSEYCRPRVVDRESAQHDRRRADQTAEPRCEPDLAHAHRAPDAGSGFE
jgi:hypothetical protein